MERLAEMRLRMRTGWRLTFILQVIETGGGVIAESRFHRWMSYNNLDSYWKMDEHRQLLTEEVAEQGWVVSGSTQVPVRLGFGPRVSLPHYTMRVPDQASDGTEYRNPYR